MAIGEVLVKEGYLMAFESWKLKEFEQKYSSHGEGDAGCHPLYILIVSVFVEE